MWRVSRRRVDGKERGLDTMHLYSTSQPGLSPSIIQCVGFVLGTDDVSRTQGQRLCAQRKMFNIRHVNNVSVRV